MLEFFYFAWLTYVGHPEPVIYDGNGTGNVCAYAPVIMLNYALNESGVINENRSGISKGAAYSV